MLATLIKIYWKGILSEDWILRVTQQTTGPTNQSTIPGNDGKLQSRQNQESSLWSYQVRRRTQSERCCLNPRNRPSSKLSHVSSLISDFPVSKIVKINLLLKQNKNTQIQAKKPDGTSSLSLLLLLCQPSSLSSCRQSSSMCQRTRVAISFIFSCLKALGAKTDQ